MRKNRHRKEGRHVRRVHRGTSSRVAGKRAPQETGTREVRRAWWPLIVAFLGLTLLSTASLYVLADQTDRQFAWTIQPPLSAAFLGGGYAAGFVLIALT